MNAHDPKALARAPEGEGLFEIMPAQPIGWFLFGDAYFKCADALRTSPPVGLRFDGPQKYMFFHAMELYAKAFLRLKGVGEDELRSRALGHNLVALTDRAEQMGLTVSVSVKEVATHAYLFDEPIESRYLNPGYKQSLTLDSLYANCDDLRESVPADFSLAGIPTPSRP